MTRSSMCMLLMIPFLWTVARSAPGDVCVKFSSPEVARRFAVENPSVRMLVPSEPAQFLSLSESARAYLREVQSWCVVRCDVDEEYGRLLAAWRLRYDIVSSGPALKLTLDRVVRRDSLRDAQWALTVLQADEVWRRATGKGVVVGVIDTGIDWDHEDLQTQLWTNAAEDRNGNRRFEPWPVSETRNGVAGDLDGEDNDGNGFADDVIGYNFVDQRLENLGDWTIRDPFPYDEGGHGTNVAGVIAAAHDNGSGVSGLAYDARLMTLRAFDVSGNAEEDDIASAMLYAAENGARIINCSFGDDVFSAMLRDASRYLFERGILVVASSGNSGGSGVHYPSDFPWVMSVGATTTRDARAIFSSYNSQLSLSAPGQGIQTTEAGGGYASVSGTSFSAPMAASAAALLVQAYPGLSPAGIRQLLERNAAPIDTSRWSRTTGAGRMDIRKALESDGEGICFITRPDLDAVIPRGSVSAVEVVASVSDPLLKEWTLEVGEGMNATMWTTVSSGQEAVIQPRLIGRLTTQLVRDTTYTVRLRVRLANGREIHRSTRFHVVPSALRILDVRTEPIWVQAVRHVGVRITTDRPVTATAELVASSVTRSATDRYVGRLHYVLIDLTGVTDSSARVHVTVTDANGDTTGRWIGIQDHEESVPDTLLQRREWQAPRLFLNPQSVLASERAFIATDVSTPSRTLRSYERNGGQVSVRDSLSVPWFSRGIGDSDGDKAQEVLTYSGGETRVLALTADGRFGSTLFADTSSRTMWASRFADINGDGRSDIVAYRTGRTVRDSGGVLRSTSDAMEVWSKVNGSYVKIAEHVPTSRPASDKSTNTFSSPGGAVGDFDGDGRMDLAYTDSDGDIHVCAWDGSALRTAAVLENEADADAGTEFTTEVDMDGDGRKEILSGYPASTRRTEDGDPQPSVWTFRLVAYDSAVGYREVWRERFYGVRYGRPYYNGVAAGPIDATPGDEFVLSLFPNVYVFHFDKASRRVRPLWFKDGAWSNSAMITDMDGNGRKELVFTSQTSARAEWWEWSAAGVPPAPSDFRVRRVVFDSLQCSWIPVRDAASYLVRLRVVSAGGSERRTVSITSQPRFGVSLFAGERAEFTVTSMRTLTDTLSTATSRLRVINAAPDVRLLSADVDASSRDVLLCAFSASVLHANLHAGSFIVQRANGTALSVISAVVLTDSLVALRVRGMTSAADTLSTEVRSEYATNAYPAVRGSVITIVRADTGTCCDLHFTRVVSLSPVSVTAEWSEEVTAAALDPASYVAPEQTELLSVRFADASRRRVVFDFAPDKPLGARGFVYTITARGMIEAVSGRMLTAGAGNTISWVFPADEASSVFAFPQPCKLSASDDVRFAGVPRGARVIVLSADGAEIASVTARDDDGGVRWDFGTLDGGRVHAGVYLYAVVYADGSVSDKRTFIIEP